MDTRRTYDRTSRIPDQEELLSDSETRTSSLGEEKNWVVDDFGGSRSSRRRWLLDALKEYWWLYTTGLLLVIAGLQFAIWRDLRALGSGGSRQVGGDVNNHAPICSSLRISRQQVGLLTIIHSSNGDCSVESGSRVYALECD